MHSGYVRRIKSTIQVNIFRIQNYTSQSTVDKNFAKCPWVATAEVSKSEAVGSRNFVNIQDTENCETESDVCYLSSVKAYILVACVPE